MYFLFCPVHFLSLYCVINKLILLFIISLTSKICISVHSHSLFQFVKDQQFRMICVLSFIHSFTTIIILRKYFTRLPFFLPLSPPPLLSPFHRVHLFFIGRPNKSQNAGSIVLGWVRLSRARLGRVRPFYFRAQTQGRVFEGRGSGVRDHAGVERIGQRSLEYKPLPHAPRTAV